MMNKQLSLPLKTQLIYAVGQLGWSTLINVINLQLIFFYLPPSGTDIRYYIPQVVFLGVLNVVTLLAASGRLFDAVTDPLIANWSDRSSHPNGRRLPFMQKGILPAALFCVLMFVPISSGVSMINVVWLFVTQALFYFFLTVYVTPYFALIPEFGHTSKERLNLSTWISVTYALGIVLASQLPLIASLIQNHFSNLSYVNSLQWAIAILCTIAALCMLLPTIIIDENKYSNGQQSDIDIKEALKRTFANKQFRYYVVADFSYFMGLTIIMTGILYYITVLLQLEEQMLAILLPLMVVASFCLYPFVNILARKMGKKLWVILSFVFMSIIFFLTAAMGTLPMSPTAQAYSSVILYAIPIAFLGILPNAILGDIAAVDAQESGVNQEGMYFAARTLMQKFGQTFGVFTFALLTTFGKDIGDDLGIRLSAIVGGCLCLFAGLFFTRYNEIKETHS